MLLSRGNPNEVLLKGTMEMTKSFLTHWEKCKFPYQFWKLFTTLATEPFSAEIKSQTETIHEDQNYVEVHNRMLWDKQSAELENVENEKKKPQAF